MKKTTTKDLAEKLRSQYIKNPPEGMSDHDIKRYNYVQQKNRGMS